MAARGGALGERVLRDVAEALRPRGAEVLVATDEVVHVHDRRDVDPLVAPRRLGLVEVNDVSGLRQLPHTCRELAAKLAAGPAEAVELRTEAHVAAV